jgi:RNA polymerase sigma factor (sigma-70 family)
MAHRSLHPLLEYLRRLSPGPGGDTNVDDAQLLCRFGAQRDESAFTALVQRYGSMVWGVCVRLLGPTPEAEAAFQAAFVVLVCKGPSLRGPDLLGPWLYGVASRTALKARGRVARRRSREVPLPEQAAGEPAADEAGRDLRPILDEEVARLPARYRLPVLLCYLEGLDTEEAARRLGCPKGTVFSRLSRARDLLRRRLSRRGVGVSGAVLAAVLAGGGAARAAPPAALVASTILRSLSSAAGWAVSGPAAALAQGVLRSMFLRKLKVVAAVLLVLAVAGSGAGFLAQDTAAGPPFPVDEAKSRAAEAKTRAAEEKARAAAAKEKDRQGVLPPPPVEKFRLRAWRDKLNQPLAFPGLDDPKTTLAEALAGLGDRAAITFEINHKAFQAEELAQADQFPIVEQKPIPKMEASLATILRLILARVPSPSGAVYLLRPDNVVEVTTGAAVRAELGVPERRPLLPLVWDAFEDTPLKEAVQRVGEASGFNVVVDARVADKLQEKATLQLNNVPVDTALRLLANMADLQVVRLDNVFYLTTPDNAKRLREEQEQFDRAAPAPKPTK